MEFLIDGQMCSTRLTEKNERSWHGIVERRAVNATGDVLFRAKVETMSG